MSLQTRLGSTLDRIAAGTGASRARELDAKRAARNGQPSSPDERLEAVVVRLEAVADGIERDLAQPTPLRRAA